MIDKWGKILSVLVFAIIVYFAVRNGSVLYKNRMKSGIVTNCYVQDIVAPNARSNGGYIYSYTFYYKGKKYDTHSPPYDFTGNLHILDKFLNKTFPVIVDTTNLNNSDILLTKKRFRAYNLPFPDSLAWTNQYFD